MENEFGPTKRFTENRLTLRMENELLDAGGVITGGAAVSAVAAQRDGALRSPSCVEVACSPRVPGFSPGPPTVHRCAQPPPQTLVKAAVQDG